MDRSSEREKFSDIIVNIKIDFDDFIYSGHYKLHKVILYREAGQYFKTLLGDWHDQKLDEIEVVLPKLYDNYITYDFESENKEAGIKIFDNNNSTKNWQITEEDPNKEPPTKLNKDKIDQILDNIFGFIYEAKNTNTEEGGNKVTDFLKYLNFPAWLDYMTIADYLSMNSLIEQLSTIYNKRFLRPHPEIFIIYQLTLEGCMLRSTKTVTDTRQFIELNFTEIIKNIIDDSFIRVLNHDNLLIFNEEIMERCSRGNDFFGNFEKESKSGLNLEPSEQDVGCQDLGQPKLKRSRLALDLNLNFKSEELEDNDDCDTDVLNLSQDLVNSLPPYFESSDSNDDSFHFDDYNNAVLEIFSKLTFSTVYKILDSDLMVTEMDTIFKFLMCYFYSCLLDKRLKIWDYQSRDFKLFQIRALYLLKTFVQLDDPDNTGRILSLTRQKSESKFNRLEEKIKNSPTSTPKRTFTHIYYMDFARKVCFEKFKSIDIRNVHVDVSNINRSINPLSTTSKFSSNSNSKKLTFETITEEFLSHFLNGILRLWIFGENQKMRQTTSGSLISGKNYKPLDSGTKRKLDFNDNEVSYQLTQFNQFDYTMTNFLDSPAKSRVPFETILILGGWQGNSEEDPRYGPCNACNIWNHGVERWSRAVNCVTPSNICYNGTAFFEPFIYVIGGYDGNKANSAGLRLCYRVDINTCKWERIANLRKERLYTTCCAYKEDNAIIAIGGGTRVPIPEYLGAEYDDWDVYSHTIIPDYINKKGKLSLVEKYDINKDCWVRLPNMRNCRSDCSAIIVNEMIFVAGGFNGYVCLKSTEYYDFKNNNVWVKLKDMQSPRSGLGLIYYDNSLVAMGGYEGNNGDRHQTSEMLRIFKGQEQYDSDLRKKEKLETLENLNLKQENLKKINKTSQAESNDKENKSTKNKRNVIQTRATGVLTRGVKRKSLESIRKLDESVEWLLLPHRLQQGRSNFGSCVFNGNEIFICGGYNEGTLKSCERFQGSFFKMEDGQRCENNDRSENENDEDNVFREMLNIDVGQGIGDLGDSDSGPSSRQNSTLRYKEFTTNTWKSIEDLPIELSAMSVCNVSCSEKPLRRLFGI